jgi:glutamine amidotransferase
LTGAAPAQARASSGTPPRVDVVDYGVNNIGSVLNMLRRLGVDAVPARRAEDLENARAIVLPGIGAFDAGVANLHANGLFDAIRARVREHHVPVLGICLGMQLLSRGSEEGTREGLGLVAATTRRLAPPDTGHARLRIPHMGWNDTTCLDGELFAGLGSGLGAPRFYYVHSYHVVCDDPRDVAATCSYGETFTAAVRRGHVMGTQFHPEKSHRFGKQVFASFVRLALPDAAVVAPALA